LQLNLFSKIAGADLTEALKRAPHGEELIKKFPIVGILVNHVNE